METITRKNKIAFSYLGGKFYHLDWLLPKLECVNANSFVDLFAGSFCVSLNIKPHKINTANDINKDVTNFFQVLRTQPAELINVLQLTPYSREEYLLSVYSPNDTPLERARKFFIRVIQSKFSIGAQRHSAGWATTTKDSRANLSEYVNKWLNKINGLTDIIQTLKLLQIESSDFRKVIKDYSGKRTLIYADPPYPVESRTSGKQYAFEMVDNDHIDLSVLLHNSEGYKAVSGYDCPLMRELYSDWYLSKAPISRRNIAKDDRQECLWTSYDPNTINTLTLF